jgi:transketolase
MHLEAKILAKKIRCSSLKMVHQANASHIGSALSIADIVAVLYSCILKIDPKKPNLKMRDRFILSKGHACVAVYSALAAKGFFPEEELENYSKNTSNLLSHISHKVPGVEFSTGSLGHGLPFGVGKTLAASLMKKKWKTYVLLSDGEMNEGSNWEAIMFAAHHKLENIVAIVDYNKLQSLATIEKTIRIEPFAEKVRAFGWAVQEVDGHNHESIEKILTNTPWEKGKPSFLIAHTIKGKGVSFMENKIEWHYKSPTEIQLNTALEELKNA